MQMSAWKRDLGAQRCVDRFGRRQGLPSLLELTLNIQRVALVIGGLELATLVGCKHRNYRNATVNLFLAQMGEASARC